MFATVTTCLLLMSVLAPVVEGNCTVVVNGVHTISAKVSQPMLNREWNVGLTQMNRLVCLRCPMTRVGKPLYPSHP